MKTKLRSTLTSISLALLMSPFTAVAGDTMSVDQAVGHFAAMGDALANDSVAGVAEPAGALRAMLDSHLAEMQQHGDTAHHGHETSMPSSKAEHAAMRTALEELAKGELELEAARQAYKTLASQFVPMAQSVYEGDGSGPRWAVMSCPMVKATWIQSDGPVANPYYGSKMATCGEKVADLGKGDEPHEETAHDDHGGDSDHGHHHGG